jgi:hypothetical protein
MCGSEVDDDGVAQDDADERAPLPLERAELERCRSRLRDESRRDDEGREQPSCKRQLHGRPPKVSPRPVLRVGPS